MYIYIFDCIVAMKWCNTNVKRMAQLNENENKWENAKMIRVDGCTFDVCTLFGPCISHMRVHYIRDLVLLSLMLWRFWVSDSNFYNAFFLVGKEHTNRWILLDLSPCLSDSMYNYDFIAAHILAGDKKTLSSKTH